MTKRSLQIILLFNLFTASIICLQAKDWRGIIPLRSSKTDVDRILGKPRYSSESNAIYSLKDEEVEVDFSTKTYFDDCVKELPAQTVLNITVVPKNELKLSEFIIDEKQFTNYDPPLRQIPNFSASPYRFGDVGYLNKEEGIVVRGYKGNILATLYFAGIKDKNLCKEYNEGADTFGIVYIDIFNKWYLNNSFTDDDIFIDLLGCYRDISEAPLFNCLIVNFGTDQEAAKRSNRIYKFLTRISPKFKLDRRRFKFVRGKSNQSASTMIIAYPIGMEPSY